MLALDLDGGTRLAREAQDTLGLVQHLREQELDCDALVELDVVRGDDDSHSADAEHPVDAVLTGEDVPFADADVLVSQVSHSRSPHAFDESPTHNANSKESKIARKVPLNRSVAALPTERTSRLAAWSARSARYRAVPLRG